MAVGIIIHVSAGKEKRTELFSEENIRFGADETCDLEIRTEKIAASGVWLELGLSDKIYRVLDFQPSLNLTLNGVPIHRFAPVKDGDTIAIPNTDISFSFFSLASKSSLITTNRELHVAPFIESAALESAVSPKRDDAKAFLREFVRELSREISWATKLIVLAIVLASLSGIFYLGNSYNNELQRTRELAEQQAQVVKQLQEQLVQNNQQLGQLDKSNKDIIKSVSLAPNLTESSLDDIGVFIDTERIQSRRHNAVIELFDEFKRVRVEFRVAVADDDFRFFIRRSLPFVAA